MSIVSPDGRVILSNLPADMDSELLSLRALGMQKNSDDTSRKFGYGQTQCVSFQTEKGLLLLTRLSNYLLILLGKDLLRSEVLVLLNQIHNSASTAKFELKNDDLAKLSKMSHHLNQSELKMRMLTIEASEDLQTLLVEIGTNKGVIGCLIVGHDGLLIANTLPEEIDAESIGVFSLGIYMNTEFTMKKMGHERIHQIVNRMPRGYVVIADFGGGLLVVLTDFTEPDLLIPLMRNITDLVS